MRPQVDSIDSVIPSALIFFGSYLSITGGVYMLFVMAEDALKKEDRDYIAIWLIGADLPEDLPNWPTMFVALFDRVFTEKHLSWRCFRRSSVASFTAVAALTLAVAAVDASIIVEFFGGETIFIGVSFFAFLALLFNLLPDYLSLYETRLVLGFMAKSDAGLRVPALLLFDLAATALISSVVGFGVMSQIGGVFFGSYPTVNRIVVVFWQGLTFSGETATVGIFIYSTFITSVWVWLYALSGFLVKGISATRKGLHFLQRHLDLAKHPLRSMGFVLMLLVTVGYVVWGAALVF